MMASVFLARSRKQKGRWSNRIITIKAVNRRPGLLGLSQKREIGFFF